MVPSIPSLSELDHVARNEIFIKSRCLHGICLRGIGPTVSDLKVAQLKNDYMPALFYEPEQSSSQVETFSTISPSDFAFLEKGWSAEAVSMRRACVPAILGDHVPPLPDPAKTSYTLGRFQVPCVAISINPRYLSPTQAFVGDVTSALDSPDRTSRLRNLQRVLSEYGHVLANHMLIGVSLITNRKKPFTTNEGQLKEEETLKSQLLQMIYSAARESSNIYDQWLHLYTRV
ncbi:hypothetical protein BOTBODRAFT_599923 [Botryobasidium botryosum FD-172 SS1]|uniref:MACPF-like domain-containing protein n=1 Tax=Botryobasidium botryosum (strain FD-172 SS1) TaxID=930990 RepID=A0A067MR54_BOTB1|nr:hypothetical protein BOTBODRAFT_599923 [Botryobasidium botryosum FD-172 SS1]